MGRKRTIDREATMAAIEAVVRKQGVGGLSIDAVAKEAGISKSSVVYDFRSKAGLLAAFTHSRLEARAEALNALVPDDDEPNRWLRALIRANEAAPTKHDTDIAMLVTSAMSAQEECHAIMRSEINRVLELVREEATNPRGAILACLALHGMKSLEFYGFHRFSDEERVQLLQDISRLFESPPDPSAASLTDCCRNQVNDLPQSSENNK